MIKAKRKPRKCPECGSAKIARIQYGMPICSPELDRNLESGKVVLGGCCQEINAPAWKCAACGAEIVKEVSEDE